MSSKTIKKLEILPYMTIPDAARVSGLSQRFIRELVKKDCIQILKNGNRTMIKMDFLLAYHDKWEGGK